MQHEYCDWVDLLNFAERDFCTYDRYILCIYALCMLIEGKKVRKFYATILLVQFVFNTLFNTVKATYFLKISAMQGILAFRNIGYMHCLSMSLKHYTT